jgi:hypothetical protein
MNFGDGNHDNAKGRRPRTEEQLDRGVSLRLDTRAVCRMAGARAFTGVNVASLRGESSNQLLETLEEWNEYLEHLRPPMPHSRYDHHISASIESIQ